MVYRAVINEADALCARALNEPNSLLFSCNDPTVFRAQKTIFLCGSNTVSKDEVYSFINNFLCEKLSIFYANETSRQ